MIQRVKRASCSINQNIVSEIQQGLLLLVGIEDVDTEQDVVYAVRKIANMRIFSDEQGKMNLSLKDVGGGLLLVSQFTLAADTNSGTRASFTPAASPDLAKSLYEDWVAQAKKAHSVVQTGEFAADMQVSLVNDGPVTFWLQVKPE